MTTPNPSPVRPDPRAEFNERLDGLRKLKEDLCGDYCGFAGKRGIHLDGCGSLGESIEEIAAYARKLEAAARKAHAHGYTCGLVDSLPLALGGDSADPIKAEEERWAQFQAAAPGEEGRKE